ncbi:MAG: hypothetical protein K0S15_1109 [Solirubrobacterales bacterium]|nr:hypothetical protein [Solirubrobacterales bacterium]
MSHENVGEIARRVSRAFGPGLEQRKSGEAEGCTVAGVAESFQFPFDSREHRMAYNEDLCRDLNERKVEWMKDGHLAAGFRCECWQLDCPDRMHLSGSEWREVRSQTNRFAVMPGHVATEDETVIEKYPHFWLIEKHGEAGDAAEALE